MKWLSIPVIIGIITFAWLVKDNFVSADDFAELQSAVAAVDKRIEQKIDFDRMDYLDERITKFDDKFGVGCERCDVEVKDAYDGMKRELRRLELKYQGEGDGG